MLIIALIIIAVIIVALVPAIAEEIEYRQWLREIEEGNRRRKR